MKSVDLLTDTHAQKHDRFKVFENTSAACPTELRRVGAGYGEGKMLCAVAEVLSKSNIVISLGSAGDYSFEEAIAENNMSPKFHTFDCTGSFEYSGRFADRITFHKKCIGATDTVQHGRQFITYSTLLKQLGNPYVGLLKMDIEGYEFDVLPSVLEVADEQMPVMIAIEVHYASQMPELTWSYKHSRNRRGNRVVGGKSPAELALFAFYLLHKGYVLISKENNCATCSEMVFLKVYCWKN